MADIKSLEQLNWEFQNADLKYEDLQNTDLQNENLQNADLQNADLQSENLQYADLQYEDLLYEDLQNADLKYKDLQNADLKYKDLQSENLQNETLQYGDLQYEDLLYEDLQSAFSRNEYLYSRADRPPVGANDVRPRSSQAVKDRPYRQANPSPSIQNESVVSFEDKPPSRKIKARGARRITITRGTPNTKTRKPRGRATEKLSGLFFYVALLLVATVVFIYSSSNGKNGGVKNFYGFSYFTVLTGSMQREIPKGSIVVTQKIDPNLIKIGDDITYLLKSGDTITHRVIAIEEDFEMSGARGFQTQGLENPSPDASIVYALNVVGKVIWHMAGAGAALLLIQNNIIIIAVMTLLIMALSFTLQTFAKPKPDYK